MAETDIMRRFWKLASGVGNIRLFRNNVGQAWVGVVKDRFANGTVILDNARAFHAGLCGGSSDLIGIMPITITEEHVGKRLAVFTAVETKTSRGRLSDEQADFLRFVHTNGGVAIVATKDADINKLLEWAPGAAPDVDIARFSRKSRG